MSYEILVDPNAFEPLAALNLPEGIIQLVESAIYALSIDPVRYGERPLIPYPGCGQMYYFDCPVEGTVYHCSANFVFTVDEQAIYIRRVECRRHA